MKVESSSYEAYLEALEEWKQKMQETQATQQKEENSATDSYVPGISQMDMDIPMPSSTYNAQYIRFIEQAVGCKIRYVSVGAEREQYIEL